MDLFIAIVIFVVGLLLYKWMTYSTEEEKENERKLKESLDDEFIIDPETGAKITLEQAESGHWVSHSNLKREKTEEELNRLYSEDDVNIERGLNFLKKSKNHTALKKLPKEILMSISASEMLKKYDDWTYSSPFKEEKTDGYILFPTVTFNATTGTDYSYYHESGFSTFQMMFIGKVQNFDGHYFLREKTRTEVVMDMIRNDDELCLKGFEPFEIRRSEKKVLINHFLAPLANEKKLELEIIDNYFLMKCDVTISKDSIIRYMSLFEDVCKLKKNQKN